MSSSEAIELSPPPHNILFTIPRTASHLLVRILNLPNQPSLHRHPDEQDGYFFLQAAFPRFKYDLTGKRLEDWTPKERRSLKNAFQKGFNRWTSFLEEAKREGKGTYVKEHLNWLVDPVAEASVFGHDNKGDREDFNVSWKGISEDHPGIKTKKEDNVTCLPDSFLLENVRPTFLIRHPALTFPSSLRTAIDNQGLEEVIQSENINKWECSYQWSLLLYRFFANHPDFDRRSCVEGIELPIVLDAQDLNNKNLVMKYAKAIGLDEHKVQFQWEKATTEEVQGLGKIERRMKSTILESEGVETRKLGLGDVDVDVNALAEGWKEEFGEVLSKRLVKLVGDSMGPYEDLKKTRLRI